MSKRKKPRSYDASKRRERALASQEHALEVARRLFADRGYTATTMEAIASEAGVAVPTLYAAFGSKRGMLSRSLDMLVSGERTATPILKTADAKGVLEEPNREAALALFARHMGQIQGRVASTYRTMKDAARTEADVAELYERAQSNRFKNLEALAERLADRGPLRRGLTVEDAGRTLWALASSEVRQLLVEQAGWTPERYEAWLGNTLSAVLLP